MTAAPCPVAVVVVAWNSMDYIGDCLDSLLALEQPPAEIVVVDNGSTDGTPEHIRDGYPAIRVIACGENIGYCRANNLGFDETASPLVLALNPDTRLTPHFLRELIPAFDDPAVGIAAGKLLRFDGRHLDSAGQLLGRSRQPLDRGYGDPDQGQYDENDEVFGACGAAALYRRAMLESIRDPETGYFDETFFAFYEDLDLAWRARRNGWKAVYRHRAVGYHARGGTTGRSSPAARWAASLGRPPEVRFHIAKNRYLTILKNDTRGAYLRNLPFIWARDLGMAGVLALTSPGVLLRLWRERAVFRRAVTRRRLDAERLGHETQPGGPPPGGPTEEV
jgi:GT2 family glycosyltransferase